MSLNNFFLFKRQKEKEAQDHKEQVILSKTSKNRSLQNAQLKGNMLQRLENFCDNRFSDDFIQSTKTGSIPLKHIYQHDFRERTHNNDLHKADIYVKNYQPDKSRAETAMTEFRSGHLEQDKFNEEAPFKTDKRWLREDDKQLESRPMRFGLGRRTENQRLKEMQVIADTEIVNNQMIHHPNWKPDDPSKWVDSKNLAFYPCLEQKHRSDPPWPILPSRLQGEDHTYKDGYEVVGDLTRKRDRSKEGSRPDFISTVQPDVMASTINYSQSLRTMKQDKILNLDYNDSFSNQKSIDKKKLNKRGSVDSVIPHHHSNNLRGKPLQNLRPSTQGKIFIKSITHYNQNLIPKRPPNTNFSVKDIQSETMRISQPGSPIRQSSLAQIQEVQYVSSKSNIQGSRASKIIKPTPKNQLLSQTDAQAVILKYFSS